MVGLTASISMAIPQQRDGSSTVTVTGHALKPEKKPFSENLLQGIKAPPGFSVSVVAKDLGQPRMMAVGTDGSIYVTRQQTNDVVVLSDSGSGPAKPSVVLSKLDQVHGIAIFDNKVYLASPSTVWVADVKTGGLLSDPRVLIKDLPDGGQHRGRTIAIGPDRKLYVSIGSSCNDCAEAGKDRATIQRFELDGSGRTTFARGLRNTIGFAWHPDTGLLWGMDNGSDWKGDDLPPEELNRIVENGDYGWPLCYGKKTPDPAVTSEPKQIVGKDISKDQYCASTEPSSLEYSAHSAPIGMAFYTGHQFPEEYRGDAFVAFHGSWNRQPASGYKVVRIRFHNGEAAGFEDFLTGFLVDSGQAQFGRPAGIAMAPDGTLLVSDDANGVIYRVTYRN
jgi:glucose/arabinose dehydrogenase